MTPCNLYLNPLARVHWKYIISTMRRRGRQKLLILHLLKLHQGLNSLALRLLRLFIIIS